MFKSKIFWIVVSVVAFILLWVFGFLEFLGLKGKACISGMVGGSPTRYRYGKCKSQIRGLPYSCPKMFKIDDVQYNRETTTIEVQCIMAPCPSMEIDKYYKTVGSSSGKSDITPEEYKEACTKYENQN